MTTPPTKAVSSELTIPTKEEVTAYVMKTLCDNACPRYNPATCLDGCEVLAKHETGEYSFRKNEKGEIVRLFGLS